MSDDEFLERWQEKAWIHDVSRPRDSVVLVQEKAGEDKNTKVFELTGWEVVARIPAGSGGDVYVFCTKDGDSS